MTPLEAQKLLDEKMKQIYGFSSSSESNSDRDASSEESSDSGKSQEGNSSSEDTSDSEERNSIGDEKDNEPTVVVFNDPIRSKKQQDKHEYEQFMSSSIKNKKQPTEKSEDDQELLDKELNNLIKTSRIIEQFNQEALVGKDLRKYQENKLKNLGASHSINKNLKMFLGKKRAAKSRVDDKIEQLRNIGMWTKKSRDKLELQEDTLKVKKKKRIDKGIVGSVGKIKGGVMTVSKSIIEKINNPKLKRKRR